MDNDTFIFDYLSQYMTLSEEEIQIISGENLIREYKKGAILLKEGEIAQECFLVLKGCVKRYYLEEGTEKIMEFFIENDPITPLSYSQQEPSKYFLSCVEPCIISTGTAERTEQFLRKFPRFVPIFVKIGDGLTAKKQVFLDDLKTLSPEDRYQKLLDTRPDLVNRVPQYMIARYLGIQPESLSRIRKRIWSNQQNS